MTPRKRLLVVPALALALAGAGCGGDKADFVDGYNAATAPLTQLMSDVGGAGITPDGEASGQASKQLKRLADGLEDVETRLRELDPPGDARDEFDAMLSSLDENTAQVRKLVKAMKSGDVQSISAAATGFSATGGKLVEAETALRRAVDG